MKKQVILIMVLASLLSITACIKDHHNPNNTATVSTFAGSGELGFIDGIGTAATFSRPEGIAFDAAGNLYVADQFNSLIRKITPGRAVTTFAGNGSYRLVDGQGTEASFFYPFGMAVDASGYIYVGDFYNNAIRKISPTGLVKTLAGNGERGSANGQGSAASFNWPTAVALDASGNVYVADFVNNLIRKITPGGLVTTLAGSGTPGAVNGKGTAASFNSPYGLALDREGNIYVGDTANDLIRKISPDGIVTTFAGSGEPGAADGKGTEASFNAPAGLAFDAAGNLYVGDVGNYKIRKINAQGVVTTVAGNGVMGFANGPAASASFGAPYNVAVDKDGDVYVSDSQNNMIRKIEFGR